MGKKKKDLIRTANNLRVIAALSTWKPVCRTQKIDLGGCMSKEEAKRIAEDHERANPTHTVDVMKC